MRVSVRGVIVVIAYNRPESLRRIFSELKKMEFLGDSVDLIISIDFSDKYILLAEMAESFEWKAGDKKVISHTVNLGLRRHVMQCGDYVNEYDFLMMFEDDISPSISAYRFVKKVVSKYKNDLRIGGISLYSPQINEFAYKPIAFVPARSKYDVFLIKSAQSWGQAWTKEMWNDFKDWFERNGDAIESLKYHAPRKLESWPDSSWKKIYNIYLICKNKYFIYPYCSHSTNNCDTGFHNRDTSALYQVELLNVIKCYQLADADQLYKYDQFYEREDVCLMDGLLKRRLIFDVYGIKKHVDKVDGDIVVTVRSLSCEQFDSFDLSLKPPEMNIIYDRKGFLFKAYWVRDRVNLPVLSIYDAAVIARYFSNMHFLLSLMSGFLELKSYVLRKFYSIFKR